MTRRPVNMEIISEIKRLKSLGKSDRKIAKLLKVSRKSIQKYLANIPSVTPPQNINHWSNSFPWESVIDEHRKRKVPLLVLWEEFRDSGKLQVQYPAFWKQFQKRNPGEDNFVRSYRPGERIEVDYADGIDVIDVNGEVHKTHLFMGVLTYSRYVYGEFSYSQKSEDFLNSHVRMFEFFGGVSEMIAPDNLKSAVTKAHKYDPQINPAYVRLASFYDVAVVPARVKRPKDKALVERSIQIFQRWFFYRVRNRTFRSLVELNKCLWEHLEIFHLKIHRILKQSRRDMFLDEKHHLRPLPLERYEVTVFKKASLHPDCHLEFESNYYSAPWQHRGKSLDVWASENLVEIYFESKRIAVHSRKKNRGKFVTDPQHYPERYQAYLEVTPSYLREKAQELGKSVYELIDKLLNQRHPLANLRKAQGVIALSKKYNSLELNQGCLVALKFNSFTIKFIEKVIANKNYNPSSPAPMREENEYLRGEELLKEKLCH